MAQLVFFNFAADLNFLSTVIEAPIFGLILAGGESRRMGENKAELIYHDRPQWAYSAQLIAPYCRKVYFSVRNEGQIPDLSPDEIILDHPQGDGPVQGVLAAMQAHPDAAWLILGVNMPGVDRALINRIFRMRDASKMATCISRGGKIEALLSILEPTCNQQLNEYVKKGKNSLRQFLHDQDINLVTIDDAAAYKLDTIDTPEERERFLRKGRK